MIRFERAVGAKTLGTVVAAAIGVAAAVRFGVFRPEHLARADASSAFVVGLLSVLVGAFLFRFLRLGEPSHQAFRWMSDGELWNDEAIFVGTARRSVVVGTNDGGALDLSPRLQLAICVGGAFLLGVSTFDARAYRKLAAWPDTVVSAGSEYCPDPDAEEARAPEAEEPGCALIRRAYELGYTKTLGDCAKKRKENRAPAAVCHLRQIDEPALHYAWRRLEGFKGRVEEGVNPEAFAESRRELDEKLDRLDLLYAKQTQVLANTPRAARHIFTNLPDPGTGAFDPLTCSERYRELAHRPPSDDPSLVFEHVVGQLLFDTRYEPPAGYCREYRVHWGQPADACRALAKDPSGFLEKAGALAHVRETLERQRVGDDLARAEDGEVREVEPASFVSFECFIEDPAAAKASHQRLALNLDGRRFHAEERRVPPTKGALPVDRYLQIAKLLAPRFHYGALQSEAGVQTSVGGATGASSFSERDFRLSRLYSLSGSDVFLDPQALAARKDLLEVYPYHVHLKNYVQLFRREYRVDRERL